MRDVRVSFCTRVVFVVVLLSLLASRAAADSSLRLEAGATTARTDALASTPGFPLGGAVALTRWAPRASLAFVPELDVLVTHRTVGASPTGPQESLPGALDSRHDGATQTPSTRRVPSVAPGRPGDRWLATLRFTRIARASRDGTHGYEVSYDIAGHGPVVLFWPRERIDFAGWSPDSRLEPMTLRTGRLWYPQRLTSRTLPEVHQGILQIEDAYAKQADGAVSAMEGFAIVAGVGGLKPTLRATARPPLRATAPRGSTRAVTPSPTGAAARGGARLDFGLDNRKLDFLFNRNIEPSVPHNVQRAAGNAQRIGIADTPANRAEVIRRFNKAFNDPSSIVGPGRLPGSNVRELFLPGVTGTGAKIQFVEQGGRVITIIAK